jgi:hypothetical protein
MIIAFLSMCFIASVASLHHPKESIFAQFNKPKKFDAIKDYTAAYERFKKQLNYNKNLRIQYGI